MNRRAKTRIAKALIAQALATNATTLDLSMLRIQSVPDEIRRLTQLRSLDLRYNDLTTLPEGLCELTQLQLLDLNHNEIKTLPRGLSNLIRLQSLYLRSNNLTTLPEGLRELTQLQFLYLDSNELTTLPEWLRKLTQLQSLDLRSNELTALPEWLPELTQLQSLYLSGNRLTTLPEKLRELTQLHELYIASNPIKEPPVELLGDALIRYKSVDIPALLNYWRQKDEQGTVRFYESKLLLIGEGGAGKTTLACKLVEPTAQLPEPDDSTEGIDSSRVWAFPVPDSDETYNARLWDFGGQPIYYATHQFFFTRRSVYILVADTRNQHTNFYNWLRLQETFGDESPVLLVKNLNRKRGNRFTIPNLGDLHKRFPNLRKTIVEIDLSEIPDTVQWDVLRRSLQTQLLDLDHVGKERPEGWIRVRTTLQADTRDTIAWHQFWEIAQEAGLQRESDAYQLSDYLHNVGDILHYQDEAVLRNLVILNTEWALDAVYRVLHELDNTENRERYGRFSFADLQTWWHEETYQSFHHELLRLMQVFKLCYELPHTPQTYIAPQLLHTDAPPAYAHEAWDDTDNLRLRFSYPVFMPYGILSRAIVDLHQLIEERENEQIVWRTGVVIRDEFARAEITEIRGAGGGAGEIRIRVSGRQKRDMLMRIVNTLDTLHRAFPSLKYEKMVACPCPDCMETGEKRHFFTLNELRRYAADHIPTIRCGSFPRNEVNVGRLIQDSAIIAPDDDVPPVARTPRENRAKWDTAARKKLYNCLMEAHTFESLKRCLWLTLDKRLEMAVNSREAYSQVVFELIQEAERENWINELIQAAHEDNDSNVCLSKFAEKTWQL